MAVFTELVTEELNKPQDAAIKEAQRNRRNGTAEARRPMRGLEIKEETFAVIKLIRSNGEEIKLLSAQSPAGTTTHYTNFILQSVTEARMEKHQIVDTFGAPYLHMFGEYPRFLDVQAVLIDSYDFNWYAEFWENYDLYLRGTRSVELGARTYLFYEDNVVEGYMLQAQATKSSSTPLMASLSFRLFLTSYTNITLLTSPTEYPTRPGATLPEVPLDGPDYFRDNAIRSTFASNTDELAGWLADSIVPNPVPQPKKSLTSGLTSLSDVARSIQHAAQDVQGAAQSLSDNLGEFQELAGSLGITPLADALGSARNTTGAVANAAGATANTAGSIATASDSVEQFADGKKNAKSVLNDVIVAVKDTGGLIDNVPAYAKDVSGADIDTPFSYTSASGSYVPATASPDAAPATALDTRSGAEPF